MQTCFDIKAIESKRTLLLCCNPWQPCLFCHVTFLQLMSHSWHFVTGMLLPSKSKMQLNIPKAAESGPINSSYLPKYLIPVITRVENKHGSLLKNSGLFY